MPERNNDPEFTDPQKSKEIQERLEDLELQGGVDLEALKDGDVLEITTQSRTYTLEKRSDGFYISGHPQYCPQPTKIHNPGSDTGFGFKPGRILRGALLEGYLEGRGREIWNTSMIAEIQQLPKKDEPRSD